MKILFPTDFSEAADNAYVYALRLADALDAEIDTLHVYDLPALKGVHLPNTLNKVYEEITFESFENYKDHIPHLRQIAQAHNMSHIVCHHSLVQSKKVGVIATIVGKAKQMEADFIVMGTTGASGLKEVFLGSVAAEVLENSSCPVMAVPHAARFDGKMDKIAFATDYHELDKSTLKSAANFASWFDTELDVVHIDTTHTEPYTAGMYKFLETIEGLPSIRPHIIDHTSIEEGLVQFLEENNTDILAMRIKKRNFIQELFTYSMTKKMANHMRIPVLGLHS